MQKTSSNQRILQNKNGTLTTCLKKLVKLKMIADARKAQVKSEND
jgi:hypothetical protein